MFLGRLFSQRVGDAAHALCAMAQMQPLAAVPVSGLAQRIARSWPGTSASYLSKVVQALVQGGILASVRGPAGGYSFARPPNAISLLDVVTALEGPFNPRCPLSPRGCCALHDRCANYQNLLRLQNEVSDLLARVTIEQLASNMPDSADDANTAGTAARPADLPLTSTHQNTLPLAIPTFPVSYPEFEVATSQSCVEGPARGESRRGGFRK